MVISCMDKRFCFINYTWLWFANKNQEPFSVFTKCGGSNVWAVYGLKLYVQFFLADLIYVDQAWFFCDVGVRLPPLIFSVVWVYINGKSFVFQTNNVGSIPTTH